MARAARPLHRYVAFLRAINVGGRTIRMEELRRIVAAAGMTDVETFIASGNVIFTTPETDAAAVEHRLEAAFASDIGYAVPTFARSIEELHQVAEAEPFPAVAPGPDRVTVYVIFLKTAPGPAARKAVMAFKTDTDELAIRGREIFWRCHGNMLESPFSGTRLERTGTGLATMRNRNTIVRLARKYSR
jgi:uncharacterized protein (DUF1697 family)